MKKLFVIFIFVLGFTSCTPPSHDGATAICECYKELHRIDPEAIIQMEYFADSCKKLHISVLDKFKDTPEEKETFNKAYEHCQNEK